MDSDFFIYTGKEFHSFDPQYLNDLKPYFTVENSGCFKRYGSRKLYSVLFDSNMSFRYDGFKPWTHLYTSIAKKRIRSAERDRKLPRSRRSFYGLDWSEKKI